MVEEIGFEKVANFGPANSTMCLLFNNFFYKNPSIPYVQITRRNIKAVRHLLSLPQHPGH